jgi:hypothetical protein
MNLPKLLPLIVVVSCTVPAKSRQPMDPATWATVQRALEAERAARSRPPWRARVSVSMREPRTGRVVDGRGAIAVAPGRAMRMVLVGGAGGTMLDAWITAAQWRVAIPPAGQLRRGDGVEAELGDGGGARDLPVGFLRWLFFTPLQGTLFAGTQEQDGLSFLLRDGDAVLEVRLRSCDRGQLSIITRRSRGRVERLEECRAPSSPQPGDWVTYRDDSNGLRCDLAIESVASESPDDIAFRDPDAGGEVVY